MRYLCAATEEIVHIYVSSKQVTGKCVDLTEKPFYSKWCGKYFSTKVSEMAPNAHPGYEKCCLSDVHCDGMSGKHDSLSHHKNFLQAQPNLLHLSHIVLGTRWSKTQQWKLFNCTLLSPSWQHKQEHTTHTRTHTGFVSANLSFATYFWLCLLKLHCKCAGQHVKKLLIIIVESPFMLNGETTMLFL